MGAPYALDLRERVVAAFRAGMSRLETARLFQVSGSSVQRWSRLHREKGSAAARPMGGQRPFALAGERERILERIAQQPDLPLRTLLGELDHRDIKVSHFAISGTSSTGLVSVSKKACTPANRIARMLSADACSGNRTG
jgi:transposase